MSHLAILPGWFPVNTHSTPVPERGGCVWLNNHKPTTATHHNDVWRAQAHNDSTVLTARISQTNVYFLFAIDFFNQVCFFFFPNLLSSFPIFFSFSQFIFLFIYLFFFSSIYYFSFHQFIYFPLSTHSPLLNLFNFINFPFFLLIILFLSSIYFFHQFTSFINHRQTPERTRMKTSSFVF